MNLKTRIRKEKITNEQIAHKLGVHRVTVDAWINERRAIPPDQQRKILKLLRRIEKPVE